MNYRCGCELSRKENRNIDFSVGAIAPASARCIGHDYEASSSGKEPRSAVGLACVERQCILKHTATIRALYNANYRHKNLFVICRSVVRWTLLVATLIVPSV